MNIPKRHHLFTLLIALVIAVMGLNIVLANSTDLAGFMSSFAGSSDQSMIPGNNPGAGSVSPNFLSLLVGTDDSSYGPQVDGSYFSSDGAFGDKSDNYVTFAINSTFNNGTGGGYGLYSTGKDVGVSVTADKIGVYAKGTQAGAYAAGEIGLSISDVQYGIDAKATELNSTGAFIKNEGLGIGLLTGGKDFGAIGIGKKAGIKGAYTGGTTFGALGYKDGSLYYGVYASGKGKLSTLESEDIDVAGDTDFYELLVSAPDTTVLGLLVDDWNEDKSDSNDDFISFDLSSGGIYQFKGDKLNVDGDFSVKGLSVTKNLRIDSGLIDIDNSDSYFSVESDLESKGSLYANGIVTSGGEIGRFYFKQSSGRSSSVDAECSSGDILVGCSGQVYEGQGYIKQEKPLKEGPEELGVIGQGCSVETSDPSTTAYAYAYCFDPQGSSSSTTPLAGLLDTDGDEIPDFQDNCVNTVNSDQADGDEDGVGNECDNCDLIANHDQADNDEDGWGDVCDCDDNDPNINPDATEITGDEKDQNCDGQEICYLDNDNDGYRPNSTSTKSSSDIDCRDTGEAKSSEPTGDCNDSNVSIHPKATEICYDGIDNNCENGVDEGCWTPCTPWPDCLEPPSCWSWPDCLDPDFGYMDLGPAGLWEWHWYRYEIENVDWRNGTVDFHATDCFPGGVRCDDGASTYGDWGYSADEDVKNVLTGALNDWDGTRPDGSYTGDMTDVAIAIMLENEQFTSAELSDLSDADMLVDALDILSANDPSDTGWTNGASDNFDSLAQDLYGNGHVSRTYMEGLGYQFNSGGVMESGGVGKGQF